MLFKVSVVFLFCAIAPQAFQAAPSCTFDLMEDVSNPVIFVKNQRYVLPDEKAQLQVNTHKPLLLYCPGDTNSFKAFEKLRVIEATCVSNQILRVFNNDYDLRNLNCTSNYYSDVVKSGQKCVDNKGDIYRLGYNVPQREFFPLVEVCHQRDIGSSFYTQNEFRRYSKPDRLKKLDKPKFQQGPFFREVVNVYDGQRATLIDLVGEALTNKLMANNNKLSRGHLTPSADFVISGNRRSTFQLINTAPQWQSINEGHWNELEEKIRNKASKHHVDLKIISGTYGVLTLPNAQGKPTEIYLVPGKKIPVPQIIWKVVYHQDQGIAFLSVNSPINPRVEELCRNICNARLWGDWTSYNKGRIYCCEVSELQKKINYIPVTGITKILKEN